MPSEALKGVFRSLRTYHGDPLHQQGLDRLYSSFITPGALVFDIGAHAGDRVSSFCRLGARVVAVEPQPLMMRALRLIHGRNPNVSLIEAAVSERDGRLALHVNSANPTVSTASDTFILQAAGAALWEGQIWDSAIMVPAVTLQALIDGFGKPAFIKIDVEGFEFNVLSSLRTAVPQLSFEFTTIDREPAKQCLGFLKNLGQYKFNVSLRETHLLQFSAWLNAEDMIGYIDTLPHEVNSGDVYAVLNPPGESHSPPLQG